ncbi:MAG: thioesterase family protein [Pseudomonadota bacterium]
MSEQETMPVEATGASDPADALLAEAHAAAGGRQIAPESSEAAGPARFTPEQPLTARVMANTRLTSDDSKADVRHIVLDTGETDYPFVEGQSLGILPPGARQQPRLYAISCPRDGERPGERTLSLTVKREPGGICSNFLCDLGEGETVDLTGPYGETFLLPADPEARLLMICTGTGSAPMRAFTMARERSVGKKSGGMVLFFDGQTPDSFPYLTSLNRVPSSLLQKHLVFSRMPGAKKEYVHDRMRTEEDTIAELLQDPKTHIYISGPKEMEDGVERAFTNIAESIGQQWRNLRDILREEGRYHIETYRQSNDTGARPAGHAAAFEHEIRVTWGDCDPAKIVYTARVPAFALDAINAWWEAQTGEGWYQMELDRNVGTPFVSMRLDFQAPITPHHRLICRVWPARLGETSISFRVEGRQDGKRCFDGEFVSVFTRADAFQKAPPPDRLRRVVEAHIPREGAPA